MSFNIATTEKGSTTTLTINPTPTAAVRFLGIPELLEATLLSPIIPARRLFSLKRTCRVFKEVIENTPSLERKIFFKQAINPNKDIVPNTLFTPMNMDVEPFPTYNARKLRFNLANDASHSYKTHWAQHEDYNYYEPILCIEVVNRTHSGKGKTVLPRAFLDGFLCDVEVGVLVVLKSENEDGEEIKEELFITSRTRFGEMLAWAKKWADGN